jgi:NAD(P)-dependent dehydrogenase (short-subunit alcohol dehydrogenase family)
MKTSEVALVTGGGRGIGAAAALELASRGARVVIVSRTERDLVATASEISQGGGAVLPIRGDVTREEDVARIFREAKERFGPVTLLVNNAGDVVPSELASMSLELWRKTLDVNVTSAFLCSREALKDMLPASRGKIINVSSVAGLTNVAKYPGFVGYASSKAALIAFTEALGAEVGPKGVQVLCVSPGSVETALLARVAPGVEAAMKPVDVARVIALLANPDSNAANGTNVVVWGR